MRQMISAALGLWMALAGSAAAQAVDAAAAATTGSSGGRVLVELFTSQGCNSCPPADALLGQLTKDPRVIPLALHVDYWDYLGWQDVFARPEFARRQKSYAKAARARMVYTPQIIVAGQDRIVGSEAGEVEAAIARHAAALARESSVRLTVTRDGGHIVIRAEAVPPADRGLRVQLVRYRPQAQVTIERGENAGQTIDYHNIVTSWQVLADWRATGPLDLRAPMPGAEPAVVVIQDEGPGAVLAAAELR